MRLGARPVHWVGALTPPRRSLEIVLKIGRRREHARLPQRAIRQVETSHAEQDRQHNQDDGEDDHNLSLGSIAPYPVLKPARYCMDALASAPHDARVRVPPHIKRLDPGPGARNPASVTAGPIEPYPNG